LHLFLVIRYFSQWFIEFVCFAFLWIRFFLRMNFLILVVIHGRLSFCTVIHLLGIVLSAIFKIVFVIMSTIVSTSLCPNKVSSLVSEKKIFDISANQSILLAMAAMLNIRLERKT
jgi:hypothetical protein